MEEIDFENIKSVYFVGIGGIAMSAAANLAALSGLRVFGSDSKEVYAPAKDVLDENDISYHIGYSKENIEKNPADLYVLSAGEGLENPEVKAIIEKKLPRTGLAEFLFNLSRQDLRIVVTGTHGKTTTTALLGHILKNLDDSSFMAGGVLQNYHKNFYLGRGHYFVFEGDEYKEQFDDPSPKFHYYKPDILLLTNLEYDHPDLFGSFEVLENEFRQLISDLPEDGLIIYNADSAALAKLVHESNVSNVSFGLENDADFKVENIEYGEYTKFSLRNRFSKNLSAQLGQQLEEYQIQLPGRLNVYNALGVVAALRALGFQPEQIALDLLSFTGVKRRFEVVGKVNGITLVDDYAHHPTAVKETLEAARLKYFPKLSATNYPLPAKLWAVFEPHTFSRTKATLEELSKSFAAADAVLISEIYPAREKVSEATITSGDVVKAVKPHSPNTRLVKNKQEALDILKKEARPGDVIVVMAVGDFNRLAYELKEAL